MNRSRLETWFRLTALLGVFVIAAGPTQSLTFVVDSPDDFPNANPGDGLAIATNGYTTLRAAIEEANAQPGEDYITFAIGLYRIGIALLYIDSPLIILDDVVIEHTAPAELYVSCRIRGEFRALETAQGVKFFMRGIRWYASSGHGVADKGGMLYCHPESVVTLVGNMSGGHASIAGGAIYVDHATLFLRGGVSGTSEGDGGGIYNDGGYIYSSLGAGGYAARRGGGIYNHNGVVQISASSRATQLRRREAGEAGGAIFSEGGIVTLNRIGVYENTAGHGGALYLTGGVRAELYRCSFHENVANGNGGAIYVEDGVLRVTNCTFARNQAGDSGGAIYMAGGAATILNSTFSLNTAAGSGVGYGGGIVLDMAASPLCSLGNSIVAGNVSAVSVIGADIFGQFISLGHNLFGIEDGGSGFSTTDIAGTALTPLDPVIQFNANHDGVPESPHGAFIPQPGSPAIDAGDNALLFHPDFAGGACFDMRQSCCPRVRGAAVDIGAIEVQEGEIGLECTGSHSADYDRDNRLSLSELLRVFQFYNSSEYHCEPWTEDGFDIGPGDRDCAPHSADYNPQNWRISLRELLRLIQFYNSGGYYPCPGSEDGFCPGSAA